MLGWLFPPSCPCDPAAKAWVEERLEWLAGLHVRAHPVEQLPDAVTGSGRPFLHYKTANGQTVTVILSGDRIIGAMVDEPAPN